MEDIMNKKQDYVMRKPEVVKIVGVSGTTIWRWEKVGLFPKRLRLGANSTGWLASEVNEWLENLAKNRNIKPAE